MIGLWTLFLVESIFNSWTIPTHNLIDLNNIITDDITTLSATIEPIEIENGKSYTIVIDEEVIGQHFTYLDEYPLKIIQNNETTMYQFKVDWSKQAFYVEFTSNDDFVSLENLPLEFQSNYHVLMYEGNYTHFKHFFPYHSDPQIKTFVIPYDISDEAHYDGLNSTEFGINAPTTKIFDDRNSTSLKSHVVFHINDEALWYELILIGMDLEAPTYEAIHQIVTTPFDDESSLLKLLNIQDNVSIFEQLKFEWITPFDAINQSGTHQVIIHVKDEANNLLIIDVTLTMVLDQIPPVIEGPSSIYVYSSETPMTNDMILSRFNVTDNKGIETFIVASNQYQQTIIPGIYQVVLKATDIQNLVTTKTIMIHVIKNDQTLQSMPPWMISLSIYETMTEEDIKTFIESHLINQGMSTKGLQIDSELFKINATNPGIYDINYQTDEVTGIMQVEVLSTFESIPSIYYFVIISLTVMGLVAFTLIKKRKVKR